MRARVILTAASPEVVEAGVQLTEDVLVPNARQQAGYRGYIALYDVERGVGTAITLWEDEATEKASDEELRPGREQFAAAFGAEVRVEKYDVGVAEFVD
ncbi:hypothetical protein BH20ACT23_BH20ACT23_11310 [soil metagenome]